MNPRYAGMTLNERLSGAEQLREWDAAIIAADRAKMIAILESVDLGKKAASIADGVLANPEYYGYGLRVSWRSRWRRLFQKRAK